MQRPLDRLIAGPSSEPPARATQVRRYGGVLLALAGVTAALEPFKESIGLLNIGLIFLVVVVGAATFGGLGPGLLASVLGFLLFDFLLIPPYLTLAIADLYNLLALVVFLGLAVLISSLIARAQAEAAQALRRATDLQRLYRLGQVVLTTTYPAALLPALAEQVIAIFAAEVGWILLPTETGADLQVAARAPAAARGLTPGEMALAQAVYQQGTAVGETRRLAGSPSSSPPAMFVPLRADGAVLGLLGVATGAGAHGFGPAERAVLVTLAAQVATALEYLRLRDEANRVELLERTDQLKSALIHAVSHDLRTPLATIKTTVTSLLDPAMHWDAATQRLFLEGVDEECDRLTRLVSNLLDISRIEGGVLHLDRDWYAISEVIYTVRRRLAARLADHPLTVELAPDLPLLRLDFVKIDQVLTNLLENAIKYTPAGTPIQLRALAWGDRLAVTIHDEGPGVASGHLPRLFDKFYRVSGVGQPQGSGLGLAIAQGMIQAHGGTISARSGPGSGFTVTFTLPLQQPLPEPAPDAPASAAKGTADGR
ncbi:MAG: DUF4118 domain-containing protein [Chloroflexota bacterium]|nr:DUF4118 domain-containing protein [Chloroflexota bacterium]